MPYLYGNIHKMAKKKKDRAAADVPFSGTVCKGKGKNLGGGWRCVK